MSRFEQRQWIPRSCHEPGGLFCRMRQSRGLEPMEIPREVAGWWSTSQGYEAVTWKEIHAVRAEKQREHLANKLAWMDRHRRVVCPAQVWVFYNAHWLYQGWWCYVRTLRDRVGCGGIKGEVAKGSWLALHLMNTIPLVLPVADNWELWMVEFAKAYPRKRTPRDPRKAGILNGWTDGTSFALRKGELL